MQSELTFLFFFCLNTTKMLEHMLLPLTVLDCFDQKESDTLRYEEHGCTGF